MSRPDALDVLALRARLAHVVRPNELDGSLYLHALGACYLACDDDSADESAALEKLFQEQAEIEEVDSDHVLTALCLVEVPS